MYEKTTNVDCKQSVKTLEQSDDKHKQTQENLKLFKKIVESSTDAIGISTPGGRHWYQNAAFDSLFGNIGEDPPASLYCDNNVGSEVFETVKTDGEWSGEVQMFNADKRVLDILLRAYAIFDEAGRVQGLVGVHTVITERKKVEEALVTKASLERIISQASRRFLTLAELDTSINACLADIGHFCAAGRAYLFQFAPDDTAMNNTHEWCAPGINSEIESLQNLPLEMFPWWLKVLETGGNIHVKNVDELPPEAQAEKEILEAQNIRSVLVVPFMVENRLAGFLGFDNVASTRVWGEEELIPLRTLAEIVGTAVTRKRAVEALRQSEARFRDLADMLPQIVFETDAVGNITFVNNDAFNTFGYTKDDVSSGLNAIQMIAPKDRARAADRIHQIMTDVSHHFGAEYLPLRRMVLSFL